MTATVTIVYDDTFRRTEVREPDQPAWNSPEPEGADGARRTAEFYRLLGFDTVLEVRR